MLPAENRLKKRKDFEEVFKKGQTFKDSLLSLRLVKNNLKASRFSFIVSLKVSKKAFLRNKLKRRLKAIIKANLSEIKTGFDVALTVKPGLKAKSYQEIKEILEELLEKAKLV